MLSVTQRIKYVSQPKNGYIPKGLFQKDIYIDDEEIADIESAYTSIQGMAVDYLTRFILSGNREEAFDISRRGALKIDEFFGKSLETKRFNRLLSQIKGLDDDSIIATCRIVAYDSAFRTGRPYIQRIERKDITGELIQNIRVLVSRTLRFFDRIDSIVMNGFSFEGGYTDLVSSGDGDYLTRTRLVELKTSKEQFSSKWSLQVLMYYLLGIHSIHDEFQYVEKLCIFNALQNVSYTIELSEISDEIKYIVSHEILGYKMKRNQGKDDADYHEWKEVDGSDNEVTIRFVTTKTRVGKFDVQDYDDGIHKITIDDYWAYLKRNDRRFRLQLRPDFLSIEYVLMLKREGFLMFLSMTKTNRLCVLNGAKRVRALQTPEYYFENMVKYADAVLQKFNLYWKSIYQLATQVEELTSKRRTIGTAKRKSDAVSDYYVGRVHGCIVDIDFENHLYLNPYDGTVVPYNAYSMYDKKVYADVPALLKSEKPELLSKYKKLYLGTNALINQKGANGELITFEGKTPEKPVTVYSTEMYRISTRMFALQSIYDSKVIHAWYENILEKPKLPKPQKKEKVTIPLKKEKLTKKKKIVIDENVGRIVNGIKILHPVGVSKYHCICGCGKEIDLRVEDLFAKSVLSCGCGITDYYSLTGCVKKMRNGLYVEVVEDNGGDVVRVRKIQDSCEVNLKRENFKQGVLP